MVDDARRGAESMGDRARDAREAMNERARDAREAVNERAIAAKEATAEAIAAVKPKLRGVSHEWAFFISLVFGAALIFFAKTPKATLAVAVYAVSLSALLGTSALYHRVNWTRPNVRAWMRRLDHTMIFFLIAGTYTPFALLVMHGALATAILIAVWVGAIAGAIVEMVWIGHPKWVSAITYLAIGWVAAIAFPQLWDALGPAAALMLVGGGLLYTAGAVIYAIQRPNPVPAVFGYHEVFHAFVIAAALVHFSVIAFFALPHA
jgi:hemolysin III